MKLPKVAILLLRGLEGCGVSTYARHFRAFFIDKKEKCDIFVLNLNIGRPDTSTDLDVKIFDYSEAESIVNKINSEYDLTFVFSVPAKNAKKEIVEGYVEKILDKIKSPKWMVNHDHHYLSIGRNADYENAIKSCDGVLCHSLTETKSGFISWMKKKNISVTTKKLDMFFHMPFVAHLISIEKDYRKKRLINAARAVAWKRGSVILNLHSELAKKRFITEMIGFERSIAGYSQLKNYHDKLKWFVTDKFYKPVKGPSAFSNANINNKLFDFLDREGQDPDLMYVIGSYDYLRGMERISQSAFASHPRSFEHNNLDYGNNFEFQGLEAVLLSIPIFHRHFLETVTVAGSDLTLAKTGLFMSIDDDNQHLNKGGPQVLNKEELVNQLDEIWNDENHYRQRRSECIEFVGDIYSSEAMVPKLLMSL